MAVLEGPSQSAGVGLGLNWPPWSANVLAQVPGLKACYRQIALKRPAEWRPKWLHMRVPHWKLAPSERL